MSTEAAGWDAAPLRRLPTSNGRGAKPRPWTRWVLDMLGYDQDADSVDDLFPGSGSVAWEIAQAVIL